MSLEKISEAIRDVPDFPKKGIVFKDITTVLRDAQLYKEVTDLMGKPYENKSIDLIAGIESRGFIFGGAMALQLGCGFIPIRKPGKLPHLTFKEEYALEYGTDALEIHRDALKPGQNVLLVDDLLATGGTALAAAKLIEKCGAQVIAIQFFIELSFLNGKNKLDGYNVNSLIRF